MTTDRIREADRLDAVRRALALHSGPDTALDRVSRLAARIFDTPLAAVSFVGDEQVWFKGRFGLQLTSASALPGLCVTAAQRSGTYVLIDARADPQAANHPMVTDGPRIRFYAAAPVRTSDGHRIGAVSVMDTEPRYAAASQLAMLHELAGLVTDQLELRRAAVTVIEVEQEARNRLLAEAQRISYIADTLQDTLTPSRLPDIQGLDLAFYYEPFSSDDVGGDFFDVFPIDDKRWGIFVGDVVGKGVEAAAFTSLARYSVRTAAVVEPGPAEVLAAVNEAVRRDPAGGEGMYCTIAYGDFAPRRGSASWDATIGLAGHPPPLAIRHGSVETVTASGTIIGSFEDQKFSTTTITLEPGETILFYSDGMTDLPTGEGWLGVEGVSRALQGQPLRSAQDAVDMLRKVIAGNDQALRDDLVVLAVRVPEHPQSGGNLND
ncbi:MAG TPA: GAF domain-containing SpoIIE family protein phosphatase [Jiangellaceae bacterium]|nr:GAF domain-containing SpoIIE family protein phosphatase [Jiangellaceae bacterium]